MKNVFLIVICLLTCAILTNCVNYTLNISTVPSQKVEIYVNEKYRATTNEDGNATIEIKNVSFEQMQFIEAKSDNSYAYITFCYGLGVQPNSKNVYSIVNRDEKDGRKKISQRYDILFIVPESTDTPPLSYDLAYVASPVTDTRLSEQELDNLFAQSKYIATAREIDKYKTLDIESKRSFWKEFWQKRDLDPSTELNEFKIQYFERIKSANKQYTISKKQGWETDQGRVLIIYGEPDDIDRNPQRLGVKAYDIWHYYGLQGGIEFVFISLRGGGEMRLVHSTAQDELFDSNWERWLN